MARIQTYLQDSNVTLGDKLLGTDQATNTTKNFTLQSIVDLINSLSAVAIFDGIAYRFQNYDPTNTDPQGVLSLNGGVATSTAFSATTQIILSKEVISGIDVSNYLQFFQGKRIKVSKQDDFDVFGIFRVDSAQTWGVNSNYIIFNVTHLSSNGSFSPTAYFFLAFVESASVVDFDGVTNAGSGEIITSAERTTLTNSLLHSDVVDDVTSTSTDTPLSANQGRVLKGLIDSINTLLLSDESTLDTLQEVVDYIELNRSTLNALNISSIAGLQTALDAKVDEVVGKELTDNNFTDLLLSKLNGIASGAEVNVKADYNATTGDSEILNKPTDVTDLSLHNATELADITNSGSGQIITGSERTKLTDINVNTNTRVVTDGTSSITVPTNTDTTYDLTVAQSGDDAVISLEGSDNVDDDVTLAAGTYIDITVNSGTATIDADLTTGAVADGAATLVTGDHVFDYADPKFARKDQAETFSNNVTIQGDLIVSGSTTTVNSNQLNIGDNIITLNSDLLSNVAPSQNAGVEVNRGSSSAVSIRWNEANDNWEFTNDGSTYEAINADHPINDLTDVNITSLSNSQILRYNNVSSKWENVTLSISESGQVVDVDTTGAIKVPDGGTSARPTASAGMFRYNTDTGKFEGYTNQWGDIGGASENIVNVTVAQVSGSNKFHIDGSAQTALILIPGQKYIIDQSDSSNAGHPIKFSTTEDGTHGSGTEYTTGVTATGTPGSTGAKTEITLEQDSPALY